MSGVVVRDDNGTAGNAADDFNATFVGGDTNGNGLLDITETWTFTASRIATSGQYSNVGTVSGTPPTGPLVSDANPDNHFGGALADVPTLDPRILTAARNDAGDDRSAQAARLITWYSL